jgi:hypothetical protein
VCTESSCDWPTSYEGPAWDSTISKTGLKGKQLHGVLSYSHQNEDEESIKNLRMP